MDLKIVAIFQASKPEKQTIHRSYSYLLVHKPLGYLSQRGEDRLGRPSVYDLVPPKALKSPWANAGITPVGRLDADTTGLMLFTDDGILHNKISIPQSMVPRTYVAKVGGSVTEAEAEQLRTGVIIRVPAKHGENGDMDYKTRPAIVANKPLDSKSSLLTLTLTEGRNREVRKMCANVGHPVLTLTRISYGPLKLGNLAIGQWRRATPEEVQALLKIRDVG